MERTPETGSLSAGDEMPPADRRQADEGAVRDGLRAAIGRPERVAAGFEHARI